MRFTGVGKALLALTSLAASSLASVQAAEVTAAVSAVTFELVDLAPEDGIDPSITWLSTSADATALSQRGVRFTWSDQAAGQWSHEFTHTDPDGVAHDENPLQPGLFAGAGLARAQLSLTGLLAGLSAGHTVGNDGGSGQSLASIFSTFALSPMTALRISGNFALQLQAVDSAQAVLPEGAAPGFANPFASLMAYADIGVDVVSGGTVNAQSWFDTEASDDLRYTVSTDPLWVTGAIDRQINRGFAHELVNDDGSVLTASFHATAIASATQLASRQATVVPEPGALALALAGLGGLGAWGGLATRRRRGAGRA